MFLMFKLRQIIYSTGFSIYLITEVFFISILGISTELCSKKFKKCTKIFMNIMFESSAIDENNHPKILKFHFNNYELNAFGSFKLNLDFVKMVKIVAFYKK